MMCGVSRNQAEGDSGRARQPGARQREPGLSVQKCCNNSVVCESAANRRPVSRSRDQCYPITGDLVTSSSRTQCHHHNWPQVQHLLGNEDGHYSTVSLSLYSLLQVHELLLNQVLRACALCPPTVFTLPLQSELSCHN